MKPKRDLSMQYNLRPLKREEYFMLEEFLYDAIFVPSGEAPPPPSVLLEPSLQNYYQDFGRAHDYCLVAEQEGMLLGAVWARLLSSPLKGYGYVDEHTPELAISVQKEFRGKGIGTALLIKLLDLLQSKGYSQVSLSVQKENPAADLYKRVGFTTLEEKGDDYLMLYAFAR
jgi:ribosomal protein S18 acetylase RimI-like enzyme